MAEFTDASVAYIGIILVAVTVAAGAGWYIAEQVSTIAIAVIFPLFGYVGGMHIASNRAETVGFSVFAILIAAVFAYMLPIEVLGGVALFVVGYLLGMQAERR
jgi:hypothetical protein